MGGSVEREGGGGGPLSVRGGGKGGALTPACRAGIGGGGGLDEFLALPGRGGGPDDVGWCNLEPAPSKAGGTWNTCLGPEGCAGAG